MWADEAGKRHGEVVRDPLMNIDRCACLAFHFDC